MALDPRRSPGSGCWPPLVGSVGAGPFLAGLRLIDAPALGAALAIGVVTTVCCAWRWALVAGGLGVRLPMGAAVAALLPRGLPQLDAARRRARRRAPRGAARPGRRRRQPGHPRGGLGTYRRAGRPGRHRGGRAGRRFPSPVRRYLPAATAALAGRRAGAWSCSPGRLPRSGPSRWARALRTAAADVRSGLLARRTWAGVLVASAVVVAGHLATFLVAARTAGADAPLARLVPLTLLALLAMGLPANVGGFGPREGVAAWAFAAAGLTAAQGVADRDGVRRAGARREPARRRRAAAAPVPRPDGQHRSLTAPTVDLGVRCRARPAAPDEGEPWTKRCRSRRSAPR